MIDMQSANYVASIKNTTIIISFDSIPQFASLVDQLIGEILSRKFFVRSNNIDRHLHMFLRLKSQRFEGTIMPKAALNQLMRLEN